MQRQVLQYLVKQQGHPGMISAVASNLGDMLWEQENFEEAESVLDQACKVTVVLLKLHHHKDVVSVCLPEPPGSQLVA